jgi:2-polyprenyl-3-methyl-5-hydroxy-6-metoxy-1,4-benzoquinol methylase
MQSVKCSLRGGGNSRTVHQGLQVQGMDFEGRFCEARQCLGCGMVFFDPPSNDVLFRYYNAEYSVGGSSWYTVDADYARGKVEVRATRILDVAERFGFGPEHIYHEIGCAFGGTVHELNQRGIRTTGTDLSEAAIRAGQAYGNDAIGLGPDVDFLSSQQIRPHVVFGFHVFEHLPDPIEYLRALAACLARDAIVVLYVPNATTLLPLVDSYQQYPWFHYPAHLNLFSPGAAPCLAEMAGYALLHVETNTADMDPRRMAQVLGGGVDSNAMALIREHTLTRTFLHEELLMVLTPRDSPVAAKFADEITFATREAEANRRFETAVMDAARDASSPTPDIPLHPDDSAGNKGQATGNKRDDLGRRVEQLQTALVAIERSTSWRITAPLRRVARFCGIGRR